MHIGKGDNGGSDGIEQLGVAHACRRQFGDTMHYNVRCTRLQGTIWGHNALQCVTHMLAEDNLVTQCIAICNTHACRGHHPQVCRLGRLDIGAVIRVFESELLGFALELAYELAHMGHLSGNESTTLHTRRPYVSLVHRWLKNMVQHHVALLVFWWINKMVPPRVLVYWWLPMQAKVHYGWCTCANS